MTKVEDDATTPPLGDASPDLTVIVVTRRGEGWVAQHPAVEADELRRHHLAVILAHNWFQLSPPADDGEPLPSYLERRVAGHPTVVALMELAPPGAVKIVPLGPMIPKRVTIERWLENYPRDHRFYWEDDHHPWMVLSHYRKYLVDRLMVELFAQLLAGAWVLHGMLATAGDYALQPVPAGLLRCPDMMLNPLPGGDWFRPYQRHGLPAPPASLPTFDGLILRPRSASTPLGHTSTSAHISPKKPPFDAKKAKVLLVAKKIGGDWLVAPTEEESRALLKLHFRGVPNDPHRLIRREIWPDIRPGPRRKQ